MSIDTKKTHWEQALELLEKKVPQVANDFIGALGKPLKCGGNFPHELEPEDHERFYEYHDGLDQLALIAIARCQLKTRRIGQVPLKWALEAADILNQSGGEDMDYHQLHPFVETATADQIDIYHGIIGRLKYQPNVLAGHQGLGVLVAKDLVSLPSRLEIRS